MRDNIVIKNNKLLNIFSICTICCLVILNVSLIVLIVLMKDYFSLSIKSFVFGVLCLVSLLAIIDYVGVVGVIRNDFKLKIIALPTSLIISIVFIILCVYLFDINTSVNNIIDNKGVDQYETINVTLASYKNTYSDIGDCNNKKVGILNENEIGTTSVFKDKASELNLNPNYSEYNTTNDLFFALITNEIDIAVFPSNFRMLYEKDEEVDYSSYLKDVNSFYSFEEKVKTGENELANADLTIEPFNILLIGFAPEEGSNGKYGLSDTIIVATVNPKTMEVGLTSIARDSYVPISCYSGYKDKINAARGKSRQCLMDTVGELLDLDINLYMEANFEAVVKIVDAVGGITISSPVAFTGQTSSEVRGTYTIQIPKGDYHANGEEALAFARERHAMPGGDYDRQDHQKQVIKAIVEKILETRDINVVTNILKTCGNNLSTNLSVQQITQLFNYLISVENNTSLPLSQVIDMQNARITGYSSWYYNYSAHLPLWIYKLYNGSIADAKKHINDIMNGYDSDATQYPNSKFMTKYPYSRPKFWHLEYPEVHEDEEMPAYYKNLEGKSYAEALSWANSNGVKINLITILPGQSGYNESQAGMVINQDVPYGSLVSDHPTVTLTVMGNETGEQTDIATIDNFVGNGYSYAVSWADKHGVPYSINWVDNNEIGKNGTVKSQSAAAGTLSTQISNLVIEVYKYAPLTVEQIDDLKNKVGVEQINAWGVKNACVVTINEEPTTDVNQDNRVASVTSSNNPTQGNSVIVIIYKCNSTPPTPTCPENSHLDGTECKCDEGYTSDGGTCKIKSEPQPEQLENPEVPEQPENPEEPTEPEPETNPES